MPIAAIAPLLLLGVAFVGYCLHDLARGDGPRHLPKWVWGVVILFSIPLGGIVYLLWGRSPSVPAGGGDA
ncbi:PLDc N-terminal domain-containing protein [Embleya sp. NBC_00888]|uniref:PLDc N-terminal domain-containing protein n=1 Tax=Embleya sp. NBC_00888 TaxID=2975960 RepID=UPI0038665DF0|nr:PLDc N-terminal domain-containing protein [Embleya sp. NBC_00888]